MAKSNRTPNEQRSDAHNRNSPEHKAAADNHSVQRNNNSSKSRK